MESYLTAAERLHDYMVDRHLRGPILVGPDPGIRFNARFGRFVKSYLGGLRWADDLVYLQAQGYWILNNWILADETGESRLGDLARECSHAVREMQRPDGAWAYPNPEWSGRVATVEGVFATLGMLETYRRTGDESLLEAAKRWYDYLDGEIGFRAQDDPGQAAVNYFAHSTGRGGGVPNNSTLVLWMAAELADASDDRRYLEFASRMVSWLANVQLGTGELPYMVGGESVPGRPHFLCHQYNAFEFVDLVHYYELTKDEGVLPILERLGSYLVSGVSDDGHAYYDCSNQHTEVPYYTTAVARALTEGTRLGVGDYRDVARLAYRRALAQQQEDGGMSFYSRRNYRFLSDRRSYPRYLAMILHHLLAAHRARNVLQV